MNDHTSDPPDRLPDALDHSWKWFSYHAQQRLTAFNFYLIIVGVLVVGYFKCLEQGWRGLGFVVTTFGAAISLAFWVLDIRNTELVNCGRHALDTLEPGFDLTIRKNDADRAFLWQSMGGPTKRVFRLVGLVEGRAVKAGSWRDSLTRHQLWLRTILVFGILAFAAASISSIFGIGFDVHSPRGRFASEYTLRRVDRMMTLLNQLDSATKETPVTQGSARVIRDAALTLSHLSEEVATDCRLQGHVVAACKDLRDWLGTAIPAFQQLSLYDGAAAPAAPTPDLRDFLVRLDRIVDALRSAAGT